jgi:hypothetical protein
MVVDSEVVVDYFTILSTDGAIHSSSFGFLQNIFYLSQSTFICIYNFF